MKHFCLSAVLCISIWTLEVSAVFGPPYPVTGAWFKERYSQSEWNSTLRKFSAQGGDTVMLRAPAVVMTTEDELAKDPDFQVRNKSSALAISSDSGIKNLHVCAEMQFVQLCLFNSFTNKTDYYILKYNIKLL